MKMNFNKKENESNLSLISKLTTNNLVVNLDIYSGMLISNGCVRDWEFSFE